MDRFVIRRERKSDETDDMESASKRFKEGTPEAETKPPPSGSHDTKIFTTPKRYTATEICSYGDKCYRRNIHHFREYRHPHLEELINAMAARKSFSEIPPTYQTDVDRKLLLDQATILRAAGYKSPEEEALAEEIEQVPDVLVLESTSPKRIVANSEVKEESPASNDRLKHFLNPYEKWQASSPFYMFLSSIGPEKTFFSMSFSDVFHEGFGQVKALCHFNFMIELDWLMEQTITGGVWGKPTAIIYGTENPDIEKATREFEWVDSARAKSPHAFGHHHTKMTLVEYEDSSVRFLIYTANLTESDWLNKTQGIWISPACPPMSRSGISNGESDTGFRGDMLAYLVSYQMRQLERWMKLIREADCSEINVVLVASAPNVAQSIGGNGFRWGLKKVDTVLKKHQTARVDSRWPIIAQCSSIGSLGPDDSWLRMEWGSLLEGPTKSRPPIKLVYPSVADVKNSADGVDGADCLPYSNMVHSKQRWLEKHMCKWVGFRFNRTYALPHIKTYCRVSEDYKQMAWFILTSANLSKAAWGKLNKKQDQLIVMSWECGVMFLPKFVVNTESFQGEEKEIDNGSRASSRIAMERKTIGYPFPVPYDLPLTPYTEASKPWLVDYLGHPRRQKPVVAD